LYDITFVFEQLSFGIMSGVVFSLKGGVVLVRHKAPTQIMVYIKGENLSIRSKIGKVELGGKYGLVLPLKRLLIPYRGSSIQLKAHYCYY
jgi:hypothetical protein